MKNTVTTGIVQSFPSFDYFLDKAKRRISHISQKRQNKRLRLECSLPVPALAQEVVIDLFNRMTAIDRYAGIFYWEPEVDGVWKPAYYSKLGRNAYNKGAFTVSRPAATI